MDRLVVVKFHINIANRWLFMNDTKKNNGYRSVFIKLFGHVWRGGHFFPDTVYTLCTSRLIQCMFVNLLTI